MHSLSSLLAAAAMLLCIGCGHDGPETVPVSGQVTFGGGECPGGGTIYFQPTSAGTTELPSRPATADFTPAGDFQVTSFHAGDGLVPGAYQVRIECWLKRTAGYDKPGEAWGPGSFHVKEPVVIEPGQGSLDVNFDIPRS